MLWKEKKKAFKMGGGRGSDEVNASHRTKMYPINASDCVKRGRGRKRKPTLTGGNRLRNVGRADNVYQKLNSSMQL